MGAAGGLAAVGTGIQFAGVGQQIRGLKTEGAAARQRGDYQAAVLRNNAILSRRAAEDARERGRIAVGRKQTAIGQMIGNQRAALAASGILVDEGSAVDILADTAFVGEQEINDIRTNAERLALAHEIEAMNFEADAGLAKLVGEQKEKAAKQAIPGTILSGFGNAASGAASFYKG